MFIVKTRSVLSGKSLPDMEADTLEEAVKKGTSLKKYAACQTKGYVFNDSAELVFTIGLDVLEGAK